MNNTKVFTIIALIATVNALGYGIIIPILYTYSMKFGLSVFQNGLLFAVFSFCAFLSAPFIGRLSDKFGRKPLLILSVGGTALSFFMAAYAPSALFLFLARALDGITAGNIPVVNAVIADVTDEKTRSKGFGVVGAAFGFGFLFGPAISGYTSIFGLTVPFIIAGIISTIAVILTAILLPETNKHMGEVKKGKIIDLHKIATTLFDKNTGLTFTISLLYSLAWAMFIFAYQPVSIIIRGFNTQDISFVFTLIGITGILSQSLIVPKVVKLLGEKRAFTLSLTTLSIAFILMFFGTPNWLFIVFVLLMSLSNSFVTTLITTILSLETDQKSQGSLMGLNTAYFNLGNIVGPILGGYIASVYLSLPFLFSGLVAAICVYLSRNVLNKTLKKEAAF